MIGYKGFEVPETLEEAANNMVDMVAVVHEVERVIDQYIKEREERCSTGSTSSIS